MECLKCNHKTVCKHLSYMMDNLHIGIEIKNCKLYEGTIEEYGTTIASGRLSVPDEEIPGAIYKDFNSGYSEPISAIPVEINKVICDRCKKEVSSIEIENCVECGRQICTDCRVDCFDPNTGIVTATCEKCWSGTEDPIPGEESEKVSMSIKEEDKNWSLEDFTTNEEKVVEEKEEKKDDTTKSVETRKFKKQPTKK